MGMFWALLWAALAQLCASAPSQALASPASATKPHILLILADDLGWGNVGWHRSPAFAEVQTPNLDKMVSEGVELNRFYAYHMCSPTRSALQSGRLPMHVNIVNADPTIYNASESTGTGAGIPRNMTCMASKLKQAGYATVSSCCAPDVFDVLTSLC